VLRNVIFHLTTPSPIGPILLTSDGERLTGLYLDARVERPMGTSVEVRIDAAGVLDREVPPLAEAARQLGEYFAGARQEFDLSLHLDGTPFQRQVWSALTEIPFGETWSYAELARHIGNPKACRAVGLANGSNPISIIVPCHRVIGADGSLTGYGGGIERKRRLLAHERQRDLGGLFG
jgi:methylated-DNA-[protein]-cysteine S-methyltransferase